MASSEEAGVSLEITDLIHSLQGMSNDAYREYVEQLRCEGLQGWEQKLTTGCFTQDHLFSLMHAAELLGRHKALVAARAVVITTLVNTSKDQKDEPA